MFARATVPPTGTSSVASPLVVPCASSCAACWFLGRRACCDPILCDSRGVWLCLFLQTRARVCGWPLLRRSPTSWRSSGWKRASLCSAAIGNSSPCARCDRAVRCRSGSECRIANARIVNCNVAFDANPSLVRSPCARLGWPQRRPSLQRAGSAGRSAALAPSSPESDSPAGNTKSAAKRALNIHASKWRLRQQLHSPAVQSASAFATGSPLRRRRTQCA